MTNGKMTSIAMKINQKEVQKRIDRAIVREFKNSLQEIFHLNIETMAEVMANHAAEGASWGKIEVRFNPDNN